VAPGINAKMNEVQAAFGLLSLKQIDPAIEKRRWATEIYRRELKGVEGITYMRDLPGVKHNYSYFPIFVDEQKYGISRDALYFKMKDDNILGRRYFYPLISEFPTYRGLPSAAPHNLAVAHKISSQIICLPMHHDLTEEDLHRVIAVIKESAPETNHARLSLQFEAGV
jgi:dTDP-4-amino-4,6-dideoxygalactose transaminase